MIISFRTHPYINSSAIIIMQIVSEALFERLRQQPLFHAATHNRIAYITAAELIVRDVTIEAKCSYIKIKGREIAALSLENPKFIVILYISGLLEVRQIDSLQQLFLTANNLMASERTPKLRVTSQAVYVLINRFIEKISLRKQTKREQIHLGEKTKDFSTDFLISSILQEEKVIISQYLTCVSLAIQGVPVARLQFIHIKSMKLLKNPLEQETQEYLVVVDMNKWLKVYNLSNLQQILEMQLFLSNEEDIQIKIDPLNEYLMLRIYQSATRLTRRNSLLKINKEVYKGNMKQPFFLFDIELGLKQDLILFPTHEEVIQGAKFQSIDMCFFTSKEIRIATLVIDINHRTRLRHTQVFLSNWEEVSHWNDILLSLKDTQDEMVDKAIELKVKQLEICQNIHPYDAGNGEDWDKFVAQFIQENLQNLKKEGLVVAHDKSDVKYLEYSGKQYKQKMEQDAPNTLSGSSSFKSLGSATHQLEERLLRMLENDNFYSDGELSKEKNSQYSINEACDEVDDEDCVESDEESSQYLVDVQDKVVRVFLPIETSLDDIDSKLQRITDIHSRKLKNLEKTIRHHKTQANGIVKMIPKWCEQQFKLFGNQIKDSLKQFNVMIGHTDITSIRNIKKLKKGYLDCINQEIELRQQRLEESEGSCMKIDLLMNKYNAS